MLEKMSQAAALMQSAFRMMVVRRQFRKIIKATVIIQAHSRMTFMQRSFKNKRRASNTIKSIFLMRRDQVRPTHGCIIAYVCDPCSAIDYSWRLDRLYYIKTYACRTNEMVRTVGFPIMH